MSARPRLEPGREDARNKQISFVLPIWALFCSRSNRRFAADAVADREKSGFPDGFQQERAPMPEWILKTPARNILHFSRPGGTLDA